VQKGYANVVASLDRCQHGTFGSVTASLVQMSLPSLGSAYQGFDARWRHKGKTSNIYEVVIRAGFIIVTVAEKGAPNVRQFAEYAGLALQQMGAAGTTRVAPVTTTTTTTTPPPTTTPPSPPTTTTTRPPPPPVTTTPPPPPTTVPAPAAPSCTPLTGGGNCYEPGEYCRDDDHGVTGVAGDGETITCEDNNGWRWEPT
jgi:hypothetical protein